MIEDESLLASSVVERLTVAEAGAALLRRLKARGAKKSYLTNVEGCIRVHIAVAPQFKGKDLAKSCGVV